LGNTVFSNLEDLRLPNPYFDEPLTYAWNSTFSINSNQVTIYGYPDCPWWFNPDYNSRPIHSLWFPYGSFRVD
jgi:hypothetical protein